jgi:NAD(P)-dependent dehydrogenase (short-subunit alcohol dehydrogenase family)
VPDRFIFVTGASSGIGKASVLSLLDAGFQVFAAVRGDPAASALVQEVPPASAARLHMIQCDVTEAAQIEAARSRVAAAVGDRGLWGLLNNAGITVNGPLECLPIADLRRQLEVNVIGQAAVTQALLPQLRQAQGRIVIVGSMAGFFAAPALGPYSMSKHALEAFSDALRRELRPWGIQVCLLEPGAIATGIWQKGIAAFDTVRRAPPPGLLENYGGLMQAVHKAATESARRAAPTTLVTRAVVHALSAARPRTRYRIGNDATLRKWISRLPDRWVDALVARTLDWGR